MRSDFYICRNIVNHGTLKRSSRRRVIAFRAAMDVPGQKWNGLLISTMARGWSTFSEIGRHAAPIGDTMLLKRLRELDEDGLVARTVSAGPPTCVCYSLTPIAEALVPILNQLGTWGET
jgi:DNA-binding HxlR family transcriptional regulator